MSNSKDNSAGKAKYSLVATRSFLRDLRKLDKAGNRQILETIELLKSDPYLGKHLRGQLEGFWSLRVGDFRVIYTVEESTRSIALRTVGHRRAVYKH